MFTWEENIFTKHLHVKSQILQTIIADEGNILIDGYCTPSISHPLSPTSSNSYPLQSILTHFESLSPTLTNSQVTHPHPHSPTPTHSTYF